MDSLQVSSQVAAAATATATSSAGGGVATSSAGSKASSRSTSPCRPREQPPQQPQHHHQPHHTKSLSHGSAESAKSYDGGMSSSSGGNRSRHRSPATATGTITVTRSDIDDGPQHSFYLDDSTHDTSVNAEVSDASLSFGQTSYWANGNSDHSRPDEEVDCYIDPKTSLLLESLAKKIIKVKDLMKYEQRLRDENVNEYLRLAANADKEQLQRIKSVFEKKNQKSAQTISQLQKKLDSYQKRAADLETRGATQGHRPPREVLRDMGQGLKNVGGNIRDGITGFGGSVMSKPREFAHLIKNKFGSADNISQLSKWYIGPGASGSETGSAANGGTGSDQGDKNHHHGSATLPAILHQAASQSSMGQTHHQTKFPSDEGSECSSVTSDSIGRYRGPDGGPSSDSMRDIDKKFQEKQAEIDSLKEKLENMKRLNQEVSILCGQLQEERFRTERLEEQINDLTELHQNEVENLKQAMVDMEEKVQYQSEERLRDIHEILEHCQTKIQKMEHQALQQQQYVTLEVLDNSNARVVVVKLINVLLTILQVLLLLVATAAGIIMPFLRTRLRFISTIVIIFLSVFILRQWPEVQDIGSHILKHLKEVLIPVK